MAGLQVMVAGSWKPLKTLYVFHLGAWRRLKTLKMWDGTAWRTIGSFIQSLTVSVNPPTAVGFASPSKPITTTVQTGPVTAMPSGGLAPFSYSWVASAGVTIGNPTVANTYFQKTVASGQTDFGSATVTVADSAGQTASHAIQLEFTNNAPFG